MWNYTRTYFVSIMFPTVVFGFSFTDPRSLKNWKEKTANELSSLGFSALNLRRLANLFALKMGLIIAVNISGSLLYLLQNFHWFLQGFLRAIKNAFYFIEDTVGVAKYRSMAEQKWNRDWTNWSVAFSLLNWVEQNTYRNSFCWCQRVFRSNWSSIL